VCERAVAPLLVAAVLPRRPEEKHDPDDDAEERHDGAEDEDLRHGTIIVPGRRCGQTTNALELGGSRCGGRDPPLSLQHARLLGRGEELVRLSRRARRR
jgi:hypothetical protein